MKKFLDLRRLKQLLLCVLPGALAAALVLWGYAMQPDFMKRADYRVYDKFLERTAGLFIIAFFIICGAFIKIDDRLGWRLERGLAAFFPRCRQAIEAVDGQARSGRRFQR